MKELAADDTRLADIVRPGEVVLWGQAAAEPTPLTRGLMAQRALIGRFTAFVGISWSDSVQLAHTDCVSFVSYCGAGRNRTLAREGKLDILPCHYSEMGRMIAEGRLPVHVVLLQLAPADAEGRFSLAMAADYLVPAIARARVVIAEVNMQAPASCGPHALTAGDIDYVVYSDRPPLEPPAPKPHPAEAQVARQVASLIEDGATLQYGIGSLPEAIVRQLADRRDLGFHSGAMGDAAAALIRAGVITNARKSVDRGVSVAGVLMGGSSMRTLAHRNPAIELRSSTYTHAAGVLATVDRLAAINTAIEADLIGQVNAELARGVYVGAVGGTIDFLRGARASQGGLPIIALPSRTAEGASTIVARLGGPTTTPYADSAIIVTEHGVADLRPLTISQRVQRMIAIADPEHREALTGQARQLGLL